MTDPHTPAVDDGPVQLIARIRHEPFQLKENDKQDVVDVLSWYLSSIKYLFDKKYGMKWNNEAMAEHINSTIH